MKTLYDRQVTRHNSVLLTGLFILITFFCIDNIFAQNNSFGNPPLSQKAIEQIEKNMMSTSDWQKLNELKMLNANFPSMAYQQQINSLYEQYRFTLVGVKFEREKQAWQQQQQNRQQMQKFGYKPPPTQEDITAAQQRQLHGKPPELTSQMKMHKEIRDLLNEASKINSLTSEKDYYHSSRYLNDLPNYTKAKEKIKAMLQGTAPISLKDAYYLSESAYGDLPLSYKEYNNIIQANTAFIKQWLLQNGYNLNDPEALHLGIQKFISDTLFIKKDSAEKSMSVKVAHAPYFYDYLGYDPDKDVHNGFITKTLASGGGQCATLPVAYLLLAEALGVETYLAYNPQHSFIRYRNNKGTVVNYETTVDRFLPDQVYLEAVPTMARTKRNKIYINSLNKKQIAATVMLDLASNFVAEHGIADKKFITECMKDAIIYFPEHDFISTEYVHVNKQIYAVAFYNKAKEKHIKNLDEIEKYPDVLQAYNNLHGYLERLSNRGIQDIPESERIRYMEYYDVKGKLQTAKQLDGKSKKNLFFTK